MPDIFATARDAAKLLPSDIAKIVGVHRCTVSFWLNGHAQPTNVLRAKVNKLLDLVRLATEAGDLPVPIGVKRRERGLYITQQLAKHGRLNAAS